MLGGEGCSVSLKLIILLWLEVSVVSVALTASSSKSVQHLVP